MRLSQSEIAAIGEETRKVDPNARIYLFGSRTDGQARGGDIDLLVISEKFDFDQELKLRCRILDRIGWQKLDLLIRRESQMNEPFATHARQTGVEL